jgi:hypothetical protein
MERDRDRETQEEALHDNCRDHEEEERLLAYLITHRPDKPTEPRKEGSC